MSARTASASSYLFVLGCRRRLRVSRQTPNAERRPSPSGADHNWLLPATGWFTDKFDLPCRSRPDPPYRGSRSAPAERLRHALSGAAGGAANFLLWLDGSRGSAATRSSAICSTTTKGCNHFCRPSAVPARRAASAAGR